MPTRYSAETRRFVRTSVVYLVVVVGLEIRSRCGGRAEVCSFARLFVPDNGEARKREVEVEFQSGCGGRVLLSAESSIGAGSVDGWKKEDGGWTSSDGGREDGGRWDGSAGLHCPVAASFVDDPIGPPRKTEWVVGS